MNYDGHKCNQHLHPSCIGERCDRVPLLVLVYVKSEPGEDDDAAYTASRAAYRQRLVEILPLSARCSIDDCLEILRELEDYYAHFSSDGDFAPALHTENSQSNLKHQVAVFPNRRQDTRAGQINIVKTPTGCRVDFEPEHVLTDEAIAPFRVAKWNLFNKLSEHDFVDTDDELYKKWSSQRKFLFMKDDAVSTPQTAPAAAPPQKPLKGRRPTVSYDVAIQYMKDHDGASVMDALPAYKGALERFNLGDDEIKNYVRNMQRRLKKLRQKAT